MVQSKDSGSILKENYQPTTFKGDAPEPLPKVSEELPWEKLSKKEGELHEKVQEKLNIADEKKEEIQEKDQEKTGGAVSSIVGAATDLLSRVTHTVGHSIHQFTQDAIEKLEDVQKTRLHDRFPLDKDEKLMYEYTCTIFSGDNPCLGYLYVTTDNIGFWSDCGDYKMKVWIPLENIVSIQPGTALTKKDGKGVFIQRVESEEVNCDAILLYTKDNEVHKFYKFGAAHDPINSYWSHAWNVIDHAWRDSTEELKEGRHAAKKDPWAKDLKEDKKQKNKDVSKDKTKDTHKDVHKEGSKDTTKDLSKDFSKEKSKDKPKDKSKDTHAHKDSAKDTTKDFSKDTSKDYSKDYSKDFSKDTSKDSFSTTKDSSSGMTSGMNTGISSDTTYGSSGSSRLVSDSYSTPKSSFETTGTSGSASKMGSESYGTSGSSSILGSDTLSSTTGSGWSSLGGATTHPDSAIGSSSSSTTTGLSPDISSYGKSSGLGSDTTSYGTTSGFGSDTTPYGTSSGFGSDTTPYGTSSGLSSDTTSYGTTSGLGSDTTSYGTTSLGTDKYSSDKFGSDKSDKASGSKY